MSSILERPDEKPSVIAMRLDAKKLVSTREPSRVPGTSSKTMQGAVSLCRTTSDAMPMSRSQPAPWTCLTSPSFSASSSHSRRSV